MSDHGPTPLGQDPWVYCEIPMLVRLRLAAGAASALAWNDRLLIAMALRREAEACFGPYAEQYQDWFERLAEAFEGNAVGKEPQL